jgi:hypothetical protein
MKNTLLLLLAAMLLAGCSAFGLAYNHADWYLQHRINSYLTYDAQQQATITQNIADYLQWHRTHALPAYMRFLQDTDKLVMRAEPLRVEQATQTRTELLQLYHATMQPAIAPTARMLVTLNAAQIDELERSYTKEARTDREEMFGNDQEDARNKRAQRTLSRLRQLFGSLTEAQEKQVRDMSRSLPLTTEIYLQEKQTHQQNLIALLRKHASAGDLTTFFTAWLLTPEATRSPQQQATMQAMTEASDRMTVAIHGMLLPWQREHWHEVVKGYLEDMEKAQQRE